MKNDSLYQALSVRNELKVLKVAVSINPKKFFEVLQINLLANSCDLVSGNCPPPGLLGDFCGFEPEKNSMSME